MVLNIGVPYTGSMSICTSNVSPASGSATTVYAFPTSTVIACVACAYAIAPCRYMFHLFTQCVYVPFWDFQDYIYVEALKTAKAVGRLQQPKTVFGYFQKNRVTFFKSVRPPGRCHTCKGVTHTYQKPVHVTPASQPA